MPTNPEIKPPIEIAPFDPAPLRDGGAGVDYVHRFDSGRPGPKVAIAGLTHGNEPCGMTAIRWLLDEGMRPLRGTLTLWLGNVDASQRVDPSRPETRFGVRAIDRDLNRCWAAPLLASDDPALELRRARELLPF